MVFHYKWHLYCATVSNQCNSSKPLVQNIFYDCLIHQINSIKSRYLNLSVANTRQIFQGRLVYMLYFFLFFHVFFVFLYLKYEARNCTFVDAIGFSFWIHIFLMALGKLIGSKILDHGYRNSIIKDSFLLT